MRRTVLLAGREVPYELTWKQVKNINLRVHADGRVTVSAGPWVAPEAVDDLLRRRADFLLRALDHFAAQADRRPKETTYDAGERVYLLGKPYTVALRPGPRGQAALDGDHLILTLPDPADPQRRVKTAQAFLRETCLEVTTRLCRQYQAQLAPLGVPMPEVRVRSMTARWGSCAPTKGRVTFARQLVEAPLACVAYVVCHELVHFLHPNHSPAFYASLAELLPDWKARREVLNSYSYRQDPSP
ncbi:MAG TPA: M48 family metallopeptidase [Candidatus Evtepia faecavium]|nr:M48 family metallopeptidase [Candidatus Evtepia faecavium]